MRGLRHLVQGMNVDDRFWEWSLVVPPSVDASREPCPIASMLNAFTQHPTWLEHEQTNRLVDKCCVRNDQPNPFTQRARICKSILMLV